MDVRRADERVALPPDGEVAVIDIGALKLENGQVIDDVSIAVQRWGGTLAPTRQRRSRDARADR